MNIRCIIIEDEPIALKKLQGFVRDVPFLNLIESFDNSLDALNFLNVNNVDLLLLDIQMDRLTGIELLESLPTVQNVILITAYSQYAIKGYELNVIDYLLKPYSFERFLQAVNKAAEIIKQKAGSPVRTEKPKSVFVRTAYQIEQIALADIYYIEGMKDYLGIVLSGKKIMCLQSFRSILNVLPMRDFVRVHKSYIVNLDKIETISHHRIKIKNQLIPVSNTYQESFYKSLEQNRGLI